MKSFRIGNQFFEDIEMWKKKKKKEESALKNTVLFRRENILQEKEWIL